MNYPFSQLTAVTIIFASLLLIGETAQSQGDAIETPAAEPLYEVELIIFRQMDQGRSTPEIESIPAPLRSPAPPTGPVDEPVTPATSIIPTAAVDAGKPRHTPVSFHVMDLHPQMPIRLIDENAWELSGLYRRLDRLDAYQPLLHVGWTQSVSDLPDAESYMVRESTTSMTGLSGSITLYKQRYLHLKLDLALIDTDSLLKDLSAPRQIRFQAVDKIQESRRIRGPNSQFFDNPKFGVIAKIRKVEIVKDPAKEDGTSG